jgi:hypothetical protein
VEEPEAVVRLRAVPPTAATWAPFGWLPVPDTDPADGAATLSFAWGDPHLNVIGHDPGEVERDGEALVVGRMYRHDTHTQALVPLNVAAVIAVAPADCTFDDPADAGRVSAFLLRPLDCVVLHPGTWHWGPHPLGGEAVRLLNLQSRRYREDNASVEPSARTGVRILVLPGGSGHP